MENHITNDALDIMAAQGTDGAAIIGEQPVIEVSGNIYTIIKGAKGDIALEAMGDQIVVVQDKYRTGYECKVCDGKTHTGEKCKYCKGTAVEPGSEDNPRGCRFCYGKVFQSFEPCPECHGRGGLLVAPDISQKRATTGTVTSKGPEVKHLGVGDRVLFSLFAGSEISFKQTDTVRIMHEHEVMTRIHGVAKVGDRPDASLSR